MLLSSGHWCMQDFVCAPQEWSLCFPQSCGSPIIKSCWTSKSDSLGIPSSFVESPCWEAWHGAQNLHNTLVLLFSNLWVAQPGGGVVWDLILSWLRPSHCLAAAFLCRWTWGIFFFFGRFHCPPVYGCSTASCNFGAFAGGDEYTSFYFAILNQKPGCFLFLLLFNTALE